MVAPPAVFLGALIAVWELWARSNTDPNPILPAPSRVWDAFWRTRSLFPAHIATTLTETGVGVAIGVCAGLVVAVLIAGSAVIRAVLQPLLVISQTVPVQVLAPLLVLRFGFGLAPKIVVVALVVGFPVAVSTAAGLAGADRDQLDLLRTFGASRLQLLRLALGPSALPGLFAGLRISLTYAVAAAVIGETVGAQSGLGLYLARSQRSFRYDQVYAGVAVIIALSMALFSCVWLLSRLTCPWLHAGADDDLTRREN